MAREYSQVSHMDLYMSSVQPSNLIWAIPLCYKTYILQLGYCFLPLAVNDKCNSLISQYVCRGYLWCKNGQAGIPSPQNFAASSYCQICSWENKARIHNRTSHIRTSLLSDLHRHHASINHYQISYLYTSGLFIFEITTMKLQLEEDAEQLLQ